MYNKTTGGDQLLHRLMLSHSAHPYRVMVSINKGWELYGLVWAQYILVFCVKPSMLIGQCFI